MTPAARLSAAIGVLDRVLAGEAAEKVLTSWGRASRFAGAKDRRAVRDLVYDALRCRRSFAALGGAESGRGLVLGGLRSAGQEPGALFTGEGHAPGPLSPQEAAAFGAPAELARLVALDCPDWLAPQLEESLGADFAPVMQALRHRAPVHLRVNLARVTRAAAQAELSGAGIGTRAHPLSPAALEVVSGAERVQGSAAYAEGRVELQDAASQALADTLPLGPRRRVLDHCAGGGGKTLALAAREPSARLFAHDAAPARLRDLPARAARAGAVVTILDDPAAAAPYDLVLCDVPCSGSGAWRRAPEGKWRLDPAMLARLVATQAAILAAAAPLVAPGGVLAYATCSLLEAENGAQVAAFLAGHPDWREVFRHRYTPLDGGDGFFVAHLTR